MLFLDLSFWAFAACAIVGQWLCPARLKLAWLAAASALFHWYFAGLIGMAPILVLGSITYGLGFVFEDGRGGRWFPLSVALLIGALAFYKYSELVLGSLAGLMPDAAFAAGLRAWDAPLSPLALSFFTFIFIHYLVEIRVHGRAPVRNPLKFGVFALFFPTLASGPLRRFQDFVPQLETLRAPSAETAIAGAARIIRGLFKKVCIADVLTDIAGIFEAADAYTAPLVASLAIVQGLRIYYDFSGYSDVAIGLAQMLNLTVPENFDRPYHSKTLQEFWRRWHMSLSFWIRDYVYIPLGGNRAHRSFNLITAMFLCGLWHGASWNFAVWGLYHGVGLATEIQVRRRFPALFGETLALRWLGWAICTAFVMYGWLLFFYPLSTVQTMTIDSGAWILQALGGA